MKIKESILLIVTLCVCLFVCNSPSPTEPVPSKTTVGQLQIAIAEVPGWIQSADNSDTFCTYPIAGMYNDMPGNIDGGATLYDSMGCKELAYQALTGPLAGPNPEVCSSYAMDFVTVAKASAMFNYEKSHTSSRVNIPSFDNSTAFAKPINSGVKAFARFNKFYIEVTLGGFADSAAALTTASQFLGVFKDKIK
jgi:hypothetical protein